MDSDGKSNRFLVSPVCGLYPRRTYTRSANGMARIFWIQMCSSIPQQLVSSNELRARLRPDAKNSGLKRSAVAQIEGLPHLPPLGSGRVGSELTPISLTWSFVFRFRKTTEIAPLLILVTPYK